MKTPIKQNLEAFAVLMSDIYFVHYLKKIQDA